MKRKFLYGFGFAAAIAVAPLAMGTPVLANLQQAGEAIVQQLRQPEVKLEMGADKQITITDENGQPQVAWEALEGDVTVQPGDVIRYTIESSNEGEMAAKNLVITQPIPEALEFEIGSDKGNASAETTYSIDNGETFVAEPMVEVTLPDGTVEMQPAPAELYSHVKWDFNEDLESSVVVDVSLEATVK
ncbi:MAG: hypothetical protein AAFR58_02705 [Cyanobacteria bacterium J06627_28]